ncbi:MAG: hypothetical protein E5V77_24845, partial [Mesorhizobium sp.]
MADAGHIPARWLDSALPSGHMDAGLVGHYIHRCQRSIFMDTKPAPFVPPAPKPRTEPPSTLEMMRIV